MVFLYGGFLSFQTIYLLSIYLSISELKQNEKNEMKKNLQQFRKREGERNWRNKTLVIRFQILVDLLHFQAALDSLFLSVRICVHYPVEMGFPGNFVI